MGELRENKKRETRERISDVATELFFAHGFDAVTLETIAAAADVSKMTVLNYFARKEDLMLDREDDLQLLPFREAIQHRPRGQSPVDALRVLVDRLQQERHPICSVDGHVVEWWRIVTASPALKSRLREHADAAAAGLATAIGGSKVDALARLMATFIVSTVRTAREEGIRVVEHGGSAKKAEAAFRAVIDQGFAAVDELSTKHRSTSR